MWGWLDVQWQSEMVSELFTAQQSHMRLHAVRGGNQVLVFRQTPSLAFLASPFLWRDWLNHVVPLDWIVCATSLIRLSMWIKSEAEKRPSFTLATSIPQTV